MRRDEIITNQINSKWKREGLWELPNKGENVLIQTNYKNGVKNGSEIYILKDKRYLKKEHFRNGQLFGENLRNDKLLLRKFHAIIDGGEWKTEEREYPKSKLWVVNGKDMFVYDYQYEGENTLFVIYEDFWSVFELEFSMRRQEIREFMADAVEECFKLKVDITDHTYFLR